MSLPTPYEVQRHPWSSAGIDAHGNDVDSWGSPEDVPVHGWAPAGADRESDPARDDVTRTLAIYAPPGTAVAARDRMTVAGVLYEVVGYAEDYTHGPFLFRAGMRINLVRVEG